MECAVGSSLARELGAAPAPVRRRRRLDDIPVSHTLEVRPAYSEELPQLATLLSELIPGILAPFSSCESVHSYSKSIYSVRKRCSIVGCFACLHLNGRGLERLLDGSLSMAVPELDCLAELGLVLKRSTLGPGQYVRRRMGSEPLATLWRAYDVVSSASRKSTAGRPQTKASALRKI